MTEENKKFKLVTSKKTRYLLPNILTLCGVCLGISSIKFSIDGKYCLVTNASDGTISIYDQYSKKQIKTIRIPGKKNLVERALYHTPRPVGILMHPNGLYSFVANSNADRIEVIDMKSFTIVSTIGTGRIPDGLTFVY